MEYQKGTIPYTALFIIDQEKLLNIFPPKHTHIFGHHLTLQFNPENFKTVQPGHKSVVKIIARIFDTKGDALLIETGRSEKQYPHITLSCAEGVRRSYSDDMIKDFFQKNQINYLEQPVEIEVVEGYFNGERDVIN